MTPPALGKRSFHTTKGLYLAQWWLALGQALPEAQAATNPAQKTALLAPVGIKF